MATYNLAQENNRQNERIISQISAEGDMLREICIGIRFDHEKLLAQTKKMAEWTQHRDNKLDRMIALLEKIAEK